MKIVMPMFFADWKFESAVYLSRFEVIVEKENNSNYDLIVRILDKRYKPLFKSPWQTNEYGIIFDDRILMELVSKYMSSVENPNDDSSQELRKNICYGLTIEDVPKGRGLMGYIFIMILMRKDIIDNSNYLFIAPLFSHLEIDDRHKVSNIYPTILIKKSVLDSILEESKIDPDYKYSGIRKIVVYPGENW